MTLHPADLILHTADLAAAAWTTSRIQAAVRRGELVRIRRGSYCYGETWRSLDARQQHVVRVAAVARDVVEPVVAGRSAAAVWDIPVLGEWPADVTLLRRSQGGGTSEPGVRRTSIGARNAPTTVHHGITVTTLARTIVDLAASEGFVAGVVAADWALASGLSRPELRAALASRTSAYGSRVAAAAIEFADGAAETAGESAARAVIHQLGFEVPELQVVLHDALGEIRLDFFWRSVRKAGEFDGKMKYTREEFTGGDPADVVWREKKREDRVRAMTDGMVRILWSDVMNPPRLAALLLEAGIPRRSTQRSDPEIAGSDREVIQLTGPTGTGRVEG